MKTNLLFTAIILQSFFAVAQRFEWVSHSSQAIPNIYSPDAVDATGNIYALIGTGPAGAIIQGDTIPGLTPGDGVIIAKFSAAGNFLWGKMVNTDAGIISGYKIAVDNSGAVYSTFDFANGGNVNMSDTVFATGGAAGVIIKLDSSGHFVRAQIYVGAAVICIACLATDLYISYNWTIAKLDSAFNTLWSVAGTPGAVSFSYYGSQRCDLFVSANGELLASALEGGNSTGALPFGNDSIYFTVGGFDEMAVVKMDTSGQLLWSRTLHNATPLAVCLDSHSNVYLGMNNATVQNIFAGDTLFNTFTGSTYSAVLKWDSAGTPLWGRGIYAASVPHEIYDMAVNAQDELLISGHAGSPDISFNYDTLLSANNNLYLIKLSPAGNFIWYKRSEPLLFCTAYADGIAVRNGNEYILAGSTHNPATYQFGCISYTTPLYTNFVTFVSENPEAYPVASFTFSVSNDTTYTFTDASPNATSWHWDFGDGDTSNAQNPSHDFTTGGNYSVILTVYNGPCSSSDTLQLIGIGINEINSSETFLLFPNPTTTELRIKNAEFKIEKVEICDILGQKYNSGFYILNSELKVDVSSLSPGIYFLKAYGEKEERGAKFVKQ